VFFSEHSVDKTKDFALVIYCTEHGSTYRFNSRWLLPKNVNL